MVVGEIRPACWQSAVKGPDLEANAAVDWKGTSSRVREVLAGGSDVAGRGSYGRLGRDAPHLLGVPDRREQVATRQPVVDGGLVVSVRGHVHGRSKELFAAAMRITASVFGIIALLAGVAALLVDSAYALKILVMSSIVTWLGTTVSHI